MLIGEEAERVNVARADCGEVAMVERGDCVCTEPLCERDDRSIGATKREVTIRFDEVGGSEPVLRMWRNDFQPR